MNRFWGRAFDRLLLLALAILVIGLIGDSWLVAVCVPVAVYIGWDLYQYQQLNGWIKEGMQTDKAPDGGGLWSTLVMHLHRREVADRKREENLRDLLKQYNTVISVFPDAAVVLDKNDEIDWANRRASELLGIKRRKDRGRKITALLRSPELLDFLRQPKRRTEFRHASPVDDDMTLAFRLIKVGDGQKLLTARDVSSEVSLTEMRKVFMANASHELRTPLTVVSGYLEILEGAPELPEHLLPPVVSAMTQATRMAHIIDDLLTLSRLEKSTAEDMRSTEIDMQNLLRNLIDDVRSTMAENTHTIELKADPNLNLFAIDLEVSGIVTNLLKNAVKYTPAGTLIEVSWKLNAQEQPRLRVRDHGDGIAQEHIPHLTERFYRIDPGRSRDKGGTGLGLAIIKHILERHGGHLEITSVVGEGATFDAIFPADRAVVKPDD